MTRLITYSGGRYCAVKAPTPLCFQCSIVLKALRERDQGRPIHVGSMTTASHNATSERDQVLSAIDDKKADIEEQVKAIILEEGDEHQHYSQRAPWLRAGVDDKQYSLKIARHFGTRLYHIYSLSPHTH